MQKVEAIRRAGISVYDEIPTAQRDALFLTLGELEEVLHEALAGSRELVGLAIRSRSKKAKELVCIALGYPIPRSFKKVQPRFPGQDFDVYVQKSNNLQIWNEEVSQTRRYVLIRLDDESVVTTVKVVNGDRIAALDTTGTLTHKYQATMRPGTADFELVSNSDTPSLALVTSTAVAGALGDPTAAPSKGTLLKISVLGDSLKAIVGFRFPDAGVDQERNRGAALHVEVCRLLGYKYRDSGDFPDLTHQLLEVKLQTSPTIDLGLVEPSSEQELTVAAGLGIVVRHRDVRYALFYADTDGSTVTIRNVFLTTGADFFARFPRFEGNVQNKKIQIPLPRGFFD